VDREAKDYLDALACGYVGVTLTRWIMLALIALTPISAQARHTQTSKIRYATQDGHSKWYEIDVTYLTGVELNTATSSFRFGAFDKYALVFWGENQITIIKFKEFVICGLEFDQSCIPITGRVRGTDQEDREWEICTASYC
jgi:hypothetical protein